jgi:uncharacterized membrane protein SpoIIM required for sporulation
MNKRNCGIIKKSHIYIAIIIYICGFFLSFHIGCNYNSEILNYNCKILDYNKKNKEVNKTTQIFNIKYSDKQNLFLHLFLNNSISIIIYYIGALSLGIFSIFYLFYNASYFGFYCGMALQNSSLKTLLPYVLPHSFEIIPTILAAADGISLGYQFYIYITKKNIIRINIKRYIIKFSLYIFIILIAALCETYISIH